MVYVLYELNDDDTFKTQSHLGLWCLFFVASNTASVSKRTSHLLPHYHYSTLPVCHYLYVLDCDLLLKPETVQSTAVPDRCWYSSSGSLRYCRRRTLLCLDSRAPGRRDLNAALLRYLPSENHKLCLLVPIPGRSYVKPYLVNIGLSQIFHVHFQIFRYFHWKQLWLIGRVYGVNIKTFHPKNTFVATNIHNS